MTSTRRTVMTPTSRLSAWNRLQAARRRGTDALLAGIAVWKTGVPWKSLRRTSGPHHGRNGCLASAPASRL